MGMAENGNGGVEVGMEGWGDGRQVRNSTGPPGGGRRVQEGLSMGLE